MLSPASKAADAPTTRRSTSNAAPAQPEGKLEKVLCTETLRADPPTFRSERTARVDAASPTARVPCDTTIEGRAVSCRHPELNMDESAANTDRDGLCSVLRAELVHEALNVDLYGLLRDRETLANVPIAVTLGNPLENLDLPLGE